MRHPALYAYTCTVTGFSECAARENCKVDAEQSQKKEGCRFKNDHFRTHYKAHSVLPRQLHSNSSFVVYPRLQVYAATAGYGAVRQQNLR